MERCFSAIRPEIIFID